MKQLVQAYLLFSQKERKGIILLLIIIVFINLVPWLYRYIKPRKLYTNTGFEKELAMLQIDSARSSSSGTFKKYPFNYPNKYETDAQVTTGELFYFDPNNATAADWQRLGLREKTIQTIIKYTSKGGRFYKPEDIGKIWGLHPDLVERLLPFVRIAEKPNNDYSAENFKPVRKENPISRVVDINLADTTAFIALPGIGSKLAQRIINFRDKLGGFYTVNQVSETWGLPDSTWHKIKDKLVLTDPVLKKRNINLATVEELRTHPYLRYAIANAIVQYRNQHGAYKQVDDIRQIALIDESLFLKISPYLTVD